MMNDHDAAKEALKRRRGKGIDVAIVLGGHGLGDEHDSPGLEETSGEYEHDAENPQEEKSEELGLAPEVKDGADTHLGEDVATARPAVDGDQMATDEELGDAGDLHGGDENMVGSSQSGHDMGKLLGPGHAKSGLRHRAFHALIGKKPGQLKHKE
jgi:hypothetical protein